LLTVALLRHLLGRRSEAGFLAEVARDWARLFPRLLRQSEASRRIRWLWGVARDEITVGSPPCPSSARPSFTAIATAVLAVGAIVTAVLAVLAFKKAI
jgi:hypothetical protein